MVSCSDIEEAKSKNFIQDKQPLVRKITPSHNALFLDLRRHNTTRHFSSTFERDDSDFGLSESAD
jgi:hypothetical protein